MNRRTSGFSLVEVMITIAISAVLIAATWAVVAAVVKTDDDSRIRMELQVQAASALRKISDLLKMSGPTGNVNLAPTANDYPAFALDAMGGGWTGANTFLNQGTWQTQPGGGGPNTWNNDGVGHLAPAPPIPLTPDLEGYYGTSNEIAFKLPRPAPWFAPGALPAGSTDNAVDGTGAPVDTAGAVTWGVSNNLYQYYMGAYTGPSYPPVPGAGLGVADRQTDIYAIVLVPTTSGVLDAYGNPVPGPNRLELREYSSSFSAARYLIRRTLLAENVERIVFKGPKLGVTAGYYLCGADPLTGETFNDVALGPNQLSVSIWMWRNDLNKNTSAISAYRAKQTVTVNLRSVGQNQF